MPRLVKQAHQPTYYIVAFALAGRWLRNVFTQGDALDYALAGLSGRLCGSKPAELERRPHNRKIAGLAAHNRKLGQPSKLNNRNLSRKKCRPAHSSFAIFFVPLHKRKKK